MSGGPGAGGTGPSGFRCAVGSGLVLVGDEEGDTAGRPVLLLHGGGQTRHAWGGTREALARRGYRAVAVDLRGHGDSGWAPDGDYELDAYAADVRDLVGRMGGAPVAVGASLGGLAALLAEGESEEALLAGLVLVDVGPRLEPAGVLRIVQFMVSRLEEGFASLEEAADAVARYLPHRPRPKDLSGLEKNLRKGEDGRYRWHWDPRMMAGERRSNAQEMSDRLVECSRRLRIPTLLVRGKLSDVLSAEAAEEFVSLVPGAELVDVRDAAHMVAGDVNDAFTDAIVGFLERRLPWGFRRPC